MQNNAKNDLEAAALEEVGKLKLIVAKVGQLGTTDVASRGSLSGAGSRSGALRLSRSSGLALGLLGSEELVLTVDVGVGEARSDNGDAHLVAQGLVDNGTEDDVGLGVDGIGDNVGGVADLLDAQVLGAGDGKQDARGAIDGALEQRTGDSLLGSVDGTGVPRSGTDAHPSWRYRPAS